MNFLRQLIKFLKKLPRWLKFLWKDDCDWDYYSLLKVMKLKLENMEKFFRSNKAMTVSAVKHADEMHRAIELLDMLIENDLMSEEFDEYFKKYPPIRLWDTNLNREDDLYQEQLACLHKLTCQERQLTKKTWFVLGWILTHQTQAWWD